MALKISLKPQEPLYVGNTEITIVSGSGTTLLINGDAPVLRASERIAEPLVGDHVARLQYVVQQMYLLDDVAAFHEEYFALAQELTRQDPDTGPDLAQTNFFLVRGEFYKALKAIQAIAAKRNGKNEDKRKKAVPPRLRS